MNPLAIAQLLIVIAPLAKSAVVEGGKLIAEFRADLTQDDINKALELSRSATWPELEFGLSAEDGHHTNA
jgi:hypothetical protein